MTISNPGILSSNQRLSILRLSGFLLLILTVLIHLFSCAKEDKDVSSEVHKSTQKFSGTLSVRIVPEVPRVADDIQVSFAYNSGVSYAWEKNGVVLEDVTTAKLSRGLVAKHDIVRVYVRKGDEKGSATVVIGNTLPRVTSVSLVPVDIHRGVDISAVPVAVDPDEDKVRFQGTWSVNDKELSDDTLVLSGDLFKKGDQISFSVLPLDDEGAGPLYKTITLSIPNAQPNFVSHPPTGFISGLFTYHAKALDPDGDPLTYSLVLAPPGMVINASTGVLAWHMPPDDADTHPIEIVVRDDEGATSTQKFSLNLSQNNGTAP
ncbi:MAG: hypothetical protein EHM79_05295 [Geobacter sp.]|nr:MAG: hypothetical protein EHM79_05295 [Geobacter sp.]